MVENVVKPMGEDGTMIGAVNLNEKSWIERQIAAQYGEGFSESQIAQNATQGIELLNKIKPAGVRRGSRRGTARRTTTWYIHRRRSGSDATNGRVSGQPYPAGGC
jgi:hypothetical protein